MNRLLTSAALLAFLGATVSAQNNTATRVTAFNNRFLGCVSNNAKYVYCSDGGCYNTAGANSTTLVTPASLNCSSNFDRDYENP
jgi:hypothetical protein